MTKRFALFLSLCLVIIFIAGCGNKGENEQQPVNVELPETTYEQTKEEIEPPPVEVEEEIIDDGFIVPAENSRPIAVMIDNQGSKVLPQGGLDKAHIVYEAVVEAGITRYMPVFWEADVKLIGPVRSSRHYFLDFAMEHDAIYTHVGWSPMAQSDISKFKIANVNGLVVSNEVIWDLTKDKNNWQDSYSSMEKLLEYSSKKGYRMQSKVKYPFSYNAKDVALEGGIPATRIELKYSTYANSGYEYDEQTRTYKRLRQGKPHMERVSEKQIEVKNIIIRFTKNFTIPGDKEGRQDMVTTGSGDGWFISCGTAIKIKWSKESRSSQTKYTDEAGKEITLNRGQTWIQVMPLNSKVTIE
jgi:hypothetical protein